MSEPRPEEPQRWLDAPRHITWIVWALTGLCVALVAADFFYDKHGHFAFEQIPGIHAAIGFAAYVTLVLSAKQLRKLIKRDEDYYE